jgi:predicted GNAT family N-acyltransferase
VQLVELDRVTEQQWRELIAGEREPWGGVAEGLTWSEKRRHVGIRAPDGRLLAVAGTTIAEVVVGAGRRFDVLGIGGVFVTRAARGRGFVARLLAGLLEGGDEARPERAMLFCRSELAGLYRKQGFRAIEARVTAAQPAGRIEMPLRAMWRPLAAELQWPAGAVEVCGLPF